jgi:tRNA modification GTPase
VVEAEAIDELIRAKTEAGQEEAAKKLKGGLRAEFDELHSHLVAAAAACAVQLDYGEEEAGETTEILLAELRQAVDLCRALLASYNRGRLMQEGALVVFAGKTNAGKSSLFNRLVKEERSIVSEVHGTTRDYVEAEIDLAGVPVRLADTAGLRDTVDAIEAEGVRRTELLAQSADLIVYVVDASLGCSAEDEAYLERFPDCVKVWNKTDKPDARPMPEGWIPTAAKTARGEHELASKIHEALLARFNAGSRISCVVSSARQHEVLKRIEGHIQAVLTPLEQDSTSAFDMYYVDLQEALSVFAELVGETSPEMILDSVFSQFCVGK